MTARKVRFGGAWVELGDGGVDINAGRTFPAPDDVAARPTHANGDDFAGTALDAAWTTRNVPGGDITFPAADPGIKLSFGAQGDGLWRPAPAATNFEIVAGFRGLDQALSGPMIGIGIINTVGTGVGCVTYANGVASVMSITVTTYNYAGTGNTNVTANPFKSGRLIYLALKKAGTSYTTRYSIDNGVTWSAYSSALVNAVVVDRIGIARFYTTAGADPIELTRFNVYEPVYA